MFSIIIYQRVGCELENEVVEQAPGFKKVESKIFIPSFFQHCCLKNFSVWTDSNSMNIYDKK